MKSKGGNQKSRAPEGFYTAAQAQRKLRLSHSAFYALVENGKITRIVPPNRRDGYYAIATINRMADADALFELNTLPDGVKYRQSEFSVGTEADLQGIFNVIKSFDWPVTPVETRRAWYKVNNQIDYVVRFHGLVVGYINIMPYRVEMMEAMLSGRKRGWDVRPSDVLPFESGRTYDCFIGIAIRKDVKNPEYYGRRLLTGFLGELIKMASQRIVIHKLFATSDQEDGIKISQELGFIRLPAQEGDLFKRFELDLLTAKTQLPKRYQQAVKLL